METPEFTRLPPLGTPRPRGRPAGSPYRVTVTRSGVEVEGNLTDQEMAGELIDKIARCISFLPSAKDMKLKDEGREEIVNSLVDLSPGQIR